MATFDIGVLEAWEGAGRTWPHGTVGPDAPKARQFLQAVRPRCRGAWTHVTLGHLGWPCAASESALRALQIQSAKIVLTDSSPRRYWVEEYGHALMASTLIISDTPGENRRVLRNFGVEVCDRLAETVANVNSQKCPKFTRVIALRLQVRGADPGTPTGQAALQRHVGRWLGDDAGRLAKVRAGRAWAALNMGPAAFLDLLTETYYEVVLPTVERA